MMSSSLKVLAFLLVALLVAIDAATKPVSGTAQETHQPEHQLAHDWNFKAFVAQVCGLDALMLLIIIAVVLVPMPKRERKASKACEAEVEEPRKRSAKQGEMLSPLEASRATHPTMRSAARSIAAVGESGSAFAAAQPQSFKQLMVDPVSVPMPKQQEAARVADLLSLGLRGGIHACVKRSDVMGAAALLEQLEQKGAPTLFEYNAVISLCAKSSDPDSAQAWLERVPTTGLIPNSVCYNAVINSHAKRGDVQKAVEVARSMMNANVVFDTVTFNTLIDGCARAGDATAAEYWMEQMLAQGVKASVVSFGSLMLASARTGSSERVDHWLAEADRLGIELNFICFSAVINAFSKAGDLVTAERWLNNMLERDVPATIHCFTGLVEAALQADDFDRADALITKMGIHQVDMDASMYNWLITACGRAGQSERAKKWADAAAVAGYTLNRPARRALGEQGISLHTPTMPAAPRSRTSTGSSRVASDPEENIPLDAFALQTESVQNMLGKRYAGTVKEFIFGKFGYISCGEVKAVFKRDVFLSSSDNPAGFAKGQKVTFTLSLDKKRSLPRAGDVLAWSPSA